ncbi:receptor-like serine/threonine-protein kinase ALE2 [Lycium ferocissimum]|uniref:receptor-like serine/threonine-protein kinase ALE2 n=1 Tax=Lycium ferocissimum TaxID=112874 RepID=UPI002814F374|nr:receptor-like serine/threonine-protein kinase ALE2 [Lycium ferocissimum]
MLKFTRVVCPRLNKGTPSEQDQSFLCEIGTIAHVDHPNTARMVNYRVEGRTYLVLQLSSQGSLGSLSHGSRDKLDWAARYKIIFGIAHGLLYLHENCQRWIVPSDIKADNILLTEDFVPQATAGVTIPGGGSQTRVGAQTSEQIPTRVAHPAVAVAPQIDAVPASRDDLRPMVGPVMTLTDPDLVGRFRKLESPRFSALLIPTEPDKIWRFVGGLVGSLQISCLHMEAIGASFQSIVEHASLLEAAKARAFGEGNEKRQ